MRTVCKTLVAGIVLVLLSAGVVAAQGPETPPVRCQAMTNLFRAFEMRPAALRDYLNEGGSLEDLAAEKGVDLQAVGRQWRRDIAVCTQRAVVAGKIPSERGTAILNGLRDGSLRPFPPRRVGDQGEGVVSPRDVQDAPGEGVFSPGGWGVSPDVIDPETGESVFMPGGWGVSPDVIDPAAGEGVSPDVIDPAAGQGPGDKPDGPRPGGDDVSPDVIDPAAGQGPGGEGVFSPGGWGAATDPVGWVDDPQHNDPLAEDGIDSIDHPYYNRIFGPGGWGAVDPDAAGPRPDSQ